MEPDEFRRMVTDIRTVEKALGCVSYELTEKQKENVAFRRSLFVVEDIRAGEKFTTSNVRSVRPAHGLHPRHYNEILGCQAVCDIPKGTPFAWDMLQR
jgi:sialic acid synthase SpsE